VTTSEAALLTTFANATDCRVRRQTFEQLAGLLRDRLQRVLTRRMGCRDHALAEDVVQQVLVKLFLRANQYDPARSFWGWVYRIVRNEYVDTLRRIRPWDVPAGCVFRPESDADTHLARIPPPETELLASEAAQRMDRAIADLPLLQRSVVRLKRSGAKGRHIAAKLGISQAYVSKLYHEAADTLRQVLA